MASTHFIANLVWPYTIEFTVYTVNITVVYSVIYRYMVSAVTLLIVQYIMLSFIFGHGFVSLYLINIYIYISIVSAVFFTG